MEEMALAAKALKEAHIALRSAQAAMERAERDLSAARDNERQVRARLNAAQEAWFDGLA